MSYEQEYINIINASTNPLEPIKTNERGGGVIIYHNGIVKQLNLSSSFITKLYRNGNKRDICPRKLKEIVIDGKYKQEPTLAMLKGCYLETMLLGEGADGNKVTDLPRDKRTGKKTADHQRIDTHIQLWDSRKEHHGIIVVPEGEHKSIQVRTMKKITSKNYPEIDVQLWATSDLISPFKDGNIEYDMAVIDIKGSADLTTTRGDYCWGAFEYIDKFQGVLYSHMFELPFVYLVFDWSKEIRYKAFPLNTNIKQEDKIKANEARLRLSQVFETINKVIDDIMLYEQYGWTANATIENCKECPCIYCPEYGKSFEY